MVRPARLAVLSVPVALVFGACAVLERGGRESKPVESQNEEYTEEIVATGSRVARTEPETDPSVRPGSRIPADAKSAPAPVAPTTAAPLTVAPPASTTPAPPPQPTASNGPRRAPRPSHGGEDNEVIEGRKGKKGKKAEKSDDDDFSSLFGRPKVDTSTSPPPMDKPAQVQATPTEVEGGVEGGVVGGVVGEQPSGESGNAFARLEPNPFIATEQDRLSTFAVDVDTAAYTLARRYIGQGSLPPPAAVRVEEYVNYFRYRYAPPIAGAFSVSLEGAPSPFTRGHHVLRLGLQGKVLSKSERRPTNLVFLMDTSGSMSSQDRLPLAKEAVKMAVRNLNENDTVSIVTYAGGVSDVLAPTPASDQAKIFAAVDSLHSGGGTAMGSGMQLAYQHAVQRAKAGVVSRVIVMTDGDTNIGPALSADAMLEIIGKYVKEGVTLSTIGFGMGNYKDSLMERLADKGNGNCFYVDGMKEAKRVFEERLAGTVEVIAKDVKIQVEFNPKAVRTYRLLGYENRDIRDRDFRDDKVDAGEIGAGHTVTALYEVQMAPDAKANEALATVRIRAKEPFGTKAFEQAFPFGREKMRSSVAEASPDFRFAIAVAGTADILRHSRQSESWSLSAALSLAEGAVDGFADRKEFVSMLVRARDLWTKAYPVAGR